MADSTSLVLYDPRTAEPEVVALAGFLAGYAGRTGLGRERHQNTQLVPPRRQRSRRSVRVQVCRADS